MRATTRYLLAIRGDGIEIFILNFSAGYHRLFRRPKPASELDGYLYKMLAWNAAYIAALSAGVALVGYAAIGNAL